MLIFNRLHRRLRCKPEHKFISIAIITTVIELNNEYMHIHNIITTEESTNAAHGLGSERTHAAEIL